MRHIERIRRLAGLQEAQQIVHPDEEDEADDAQRDREVKIGRLIALAFRKIGLAIADDGVFYDEGNEREALVTLDDSEVDLALLVRLQQTGLADRYRIWAAGHELIVMFAVSPALDDASLV